MFPAARLIIREGEVVGRIQVWNHLPDPRHDLQVPLLTVAEIYPARLPDADCLFYEMLAKFEDSFTVHEILYVDAYTITINEYIGCRFESNLFNPLRWAADDGIVTIEGRTTAKAVERLLEETM